jgi:hypothetical protein
LLGPTLIANGAGVLLNLGGWRGLAAQFTRDPVLIYVAGIAVFLAGLAIVRSHNVWAGGWPVVVTIFGWLVLLGGLVRMLFPVQPAEIAVGVIQTPGVLPVAAIVQLRSCSAPFSHSRQQLSAVWSCPPVSRPHLRLWEGVDTGAVAGGLKQRETQRVFRGQEGAADEAVAIADDPITP